MAIVSITGGSGLIGKELIALLTEKGYGVIVVTRHLPIASDRSFVQKGDASSVRYADWNPEQHQIDPVAIQEADYIIHLAGAGIAEKRWSKKRKREIQQSRIKSSEFLVKCLQEIPNTVKAVISASAIGWYGPDSTIPPVRLFAETDPPCNDFLGETCRLWEESIKPVSQLGKRLVTLRTGIVFSDKGGALAEFKKPLRFGIAAILGTGRQMLSWIHIRDLCRLYLEAITREDLKGVYNAVSPQPTSNKNLTLQLAKIMRGRFYIPVYVPAFLLKIFLGEMSTEVLKSTTVGSTKIHETGFRFLFPSLESVLVGFGSPRNL
jgi:uncharacterized protein (TIGR01777 family)